MSVLILILLLAAYALGQVGTEKEVASYTIVTKCLYELRIEERWGQINKFT